MKNLTNKVQVTSNFRFSILVKKVFYAFFRIPCVKNMPKNTFGKKNIFIRRNRFTIK